MITYLDNLLRDLVLAEVPGFVNEDQVRFQPPDDAWRTYVGTLTVMGQPVVALNVYLVDLRENRRLRSNEPARSTAGGDAFDTPAPHRVDCHYLISAWSPASVTPLVEPSIDEHGVLADVATVFAQREALLPRDIYAPGPLPAGFPVEAADTGLPIRLLPADGFLKLAEFWGTMGSTHPWRPVVYLVATIPLLLARQRSGPMVTTRIVQFRVTGQPASAHTRIEIGGVVCNSAVVEPDGSLGTLPGAWVELQAPPGTRQQAAQVDALGRYRFNNLRAGSYRLIASSTGLTTVQRDVTVPSPTGEYDLTF